MMIYYFIILFCLIISSLSQSKDELVECQSIDLTPYQLDKMNLNDQEYLVNKNRLFFFLENIQRRIFSSLIINRNSLMYFPSSS
jgi:hypothetical protein